MRPFPALSCAMAFLGILYTVAEAQGPMQIPQQYAASQQCSRPTSQIPVSRTVNVTVPLPTPSPATCPRPQNVPCSGVPAAVCPTPPVAKPTPVRVEVSVRPEPCARPDKVPVVYRDPGFLQPIISSAVSLAGATIAAPFRLLETLVPLECARKCPPPVCRPPAPPNCTACALPQMVPRCGPPPCMGPPVCAPSGPSVAPLPHRACPPACGPAIPPAMVSRNEEPPCEPASLLGGIINLPGRLVRQGRVFGDMGSPATNGQPH
jgi:hypothetical protein